MRQIPIDVTLGTVHRQRTFMSVKWWQRPTGYTASINVRCEGDDDHEHVQGDVTQFTDWLGRLVGIWVHFDIPRDLQGSDLFVVDAEASQ